MKDNNGKSIIRHDIPLAWYQKLRRKPQLNKHTLSLLPFCILGFDWTSSITVVTVSAYISLAGFATHWKITNI